MKTTNKINKEWTITDPNTGQKGRQISKFMFEFEENNRRETINIEGLEVDDIEEVINSYGYSLFTGTRKPKGTENIEELYGNEANWIIAECFFEQEFY